jgi:uncharacterized protein YbaP (TraB family)
MRRIPCHVRAGAVAAFLVLLLAASAARAELACPPLAAGLPGTDLGTPHGHGLLWQVRDADGRSSVVFGTMHVADPRVTELPDVVRREFEARPRFVLEVVLDDHAMQALQTAMFYTDGTLLGDVAGPELFAAAATRLAPYHIPPEIAAAMKPWAVFTTLSLPPGASALPLDLALMHEALAAGKAVAGMETVAEQIGLFDAMPPAGQVEMLREAVCHYELMQQEIERMIDRYHARDLEGVVQIALRYADPARMAFYEDLLWERNERMLDRLLPILARGDAFVAVGALHLPGARGLLHLLEERGFTVEAIY